LLLLSTINGIKSTNYNSSNHNFTWALNSENLANTYVNQKVYLNAGGGRNHAKDIPTNPWTTGLHAKPK